MEWLRRAVALGYRNAIEIRIKSALDALRSPADYRLLMEVVADLMEEHIPQEKFGQL
jgi:hypothetical protein